MEFESSAALCSWAETVGIEGSFGNLREVLDLLPGQTDPEVAATLIEAVASWAYVRGDVEDMEASEVVMLLRRWSGNAWSEELAEQARDVAQCWQELRVRRLDLNSFSKWPSELRGMALTVLGASNDLLVEIADTLPAESDADVRAAILKGLREAKKPRKGSKLRTRLEGVLRALDDPEGEAVVKAWNSKPKWRGTPKPDPELPLAERLEQWVFEADERYGIPGHGDMTRQQVGMFLQMAEELCGITTANQWEKAREYFEDENFHGLVAGCRRRAIRARGGQSS